MELKRFGMLVCHVLRLKLIQRTERAKHWGEEESCMSGMKLSRKLFARFCLGSELFGYRKRYRILSAGCKSNRLLFLSVSPSLLSKHSTPASPYNTEMTERPESIRTWWRQGSTANFSREGKSSEFYEASPDLGVLAFESNFKLSRPNKAHLWARFAPDLQPPL